MVRRLRLISGLILFAYVVTHFINHGLGIVSIAGRLVFPEVATRTPEEVLAIHGLHRGRRQVLDPAKGLVIVSWQRSSKPA
jgi:hypothetical protein